MTINIHKAQGPFAEARPDSAPITFSIIINTVDRAASLLTLLRALEQQSYPHFEVIVVVGPTLDNTLEVLAGYQGRLRLLRCPQANLSQSRNLGILAARGDVIAFIDDDAIPAQRWLEQYARVFADPHIDASGGGVWAVHPNYSVLQFCLGSFSSLAEQADVRTSQADPAWPPINMRIAPSKRRSLHATRWMTRFMGTNMLARRQAFYDIGGFDEHYRYLADEADLALRLEQAGKRLYPLKEGVVYHIPGSSRNRVAFTNKGKWWIRSEAKLYLALKHGAGSGETLRSIFISSLYAATGNLPWYLGLLRARQMSPLDFIRFIAHEGAASFSAAWHALLRPRKLIPPDAIAAARQSTEAILPFQNSTSQYRPVVDPISFRQPDIQMPDPPLRICLLSRDYPPAKYSGAARQTHLLAQGLFELGHAVHVVTRGENEATAFRDGAYVHQIPQRLERFERYRTLDRLHQPLNYSYNVYEKVRRLVLNDGIQLVDSPLLHYEGLVTQRSGLLPVAVRLMTARRRIAGLQADRSGDVALEGDQEECLLRQAAWLLPNTHATLQAVASIYGIDLERQPYTIIPHGILPAAEDQIQPFQPGSGDAPPTVLFAGRLEQSKGILDLFEAIPQVLRRLPQTRFVIAGADNSASDGFQPQQGLDYPTYFAARHPECLPNVRFTGQVSDEQLQQLYQGCDLFVAPSLHASSGRVCLEAMNYARPVIGSRAGGIPEVIDHGLTGLLVDPAAPAQLAEAITALLQSPERRREMGLAGRQRILDQFNYLSMARDFAAAYRLAIAAFHEQRPARSIADQTGVTEFSAGEPV